MKSPITWRSLKWSVDRERRIERYRYVFQHRSARQRRKDARRAGRAASRGFKRDVRAAPQRKRKRVKLEKPLRWTRYTARATLGDLRFIVERLRRSEPYQARIWLLFTEVASASGDTPAAAFAAALRNAKTRAASMQRSLQALLR